jgi:carbonic anhydrase
MQSRCNAVVLCCLDFRLQAPVAEFLGMKGLRGNYDLITRPGAAKDLVYGDDAARDLVLRDLRICQKIHDIRDIYIIQHTDCAALGGREAFPGPVSERQELIFIMDKAQKAINKEFNLCPDIKRVIVEIHDGRAIRFEELD